MIHWIWAAFFASIIDRLFRRRKNRAEIAAKRYDTEWISWIAAKIPMPNDLIGTWEVSILSGQIPDMRRIGRVKVIRPKGGSLRGYNRTLWVFRWGAFRVYFSEGCALFQYGKIGFFNKVRKLSDRWMVGQYQAAINTGQYKVTGYFQMRRRC